MLQLSVRFPLFVGWLLGGVLVQIACLAFGGRSWYRRGWGSQIRMAWTRGILRILGISRERAGAPTVRGGALLVANHVSWLDILVLAAEAPLTFVSKSDVRHWPIIGWMAAQSGTLFLDRRGTRGLRHSMSEIEARISAGEQVVVFPEGTSTPGHDVLPFHPSLFGCAVRTDRPVQAVGIRYEAEGGVAREAAYCGDDVFVLSLLRLLRHERSVLARIWFRDPQLVVGTSARDLAIQTQSAVAEWLRALSSSLDGNRAAALNVAGDHFKLTS